ncbi:MAG: tetratricopeptide repeat protein, partial [Bacteroidota bacterium]|nr:tetratricopeptide repeat protein [Bacteroidota bacterium]
MRVLFITFLCFAGGCVFSTPLQEKPKHRYLVDSLQIWESLVSYNRISNPDLSQSYARKAVKYAKIKKSGETFIKAFTLMGIAFTQDHKDSSYYYYNLALKIADSLKISTKKPDLIYNLAILNSNAYDYKNAIVLLDSAIKISERVRNYLVMSNSYNMMGNIRQEIQDNSTARMNYETALKIAREHSLYEQVGIALSNLYRTENDQDKALLLLKEAIEYLMKGVGTQEEIANTYINIGYAETNPDSALFYYKKALEIAKNGNLPEVEI